MARKTTKLGIEALESKRLLTGDVLGTAPAMESPAAIAVEADQPNADSSGKDTLLFVDNIFRALGEDGMDDLGTERPAVKPDGRPLDIVSENPHDDGNPEVERPAVDADGNPLDIVSENPNDDGNPEVEGPAVKPDGTPLDIVSENPHDDGNPEVERPAVDTDGSPLDIVSENPNDDGNPEVEGPAVKPDGTPLDIISETPGDANGNGIFDSSDLVAVFAANEFEDGIEGNSTWSTGDWNGDGEFDTRDLVYVFQMGNYIAS